MKKFFRSILCIALCITMTIVPAFATSADSQVISSTRIDYEDGSYCIVEIVEYSSLARSSTKTGTKSSISYTSDGTAIYEVAVTGTFTYDGTTSKATSASATVTILNSAASYVSKTASTSGSKAIATGTISYSSVKYAMTVTLSCSATGVLS